MSALQLDKFNVLEEGFHASIPVDASVGISGFQRRTHRESTPAASRASRCRWVSGHLFVFFNRKADRIKVLYWGRDGMCVWYKRLERGCYHYPPANSGSLELTPGQLQMIFDGIDVERVRRYKRYQRPTLA